MRGKKTGGRQKGTPNKVNADTKNAISQLLGGYFDSGKMQTDFDSLTERERLAVAVQLINYIAPKMQATQMDVTTKSEDNNLCETLTRLSNT